MNEHPNAQRVRALFHAFHERDLTAIRAALAEDAVWHFPGHNLLSGSHRGHAGIFAFLARVGQLSDGSFALALEDVVANDRLAVAFFRGSARRGERTLDNPTCLRIRLEQGRAVEFHEFVWDLSYRVTPRLATRKEAAGCGRRGPGALLVHSSRRPHPLTA